MFTGLITELAKVSALNISPSGAELVIEAVATTAEASIGDSIAINGVCLTVTKKSNNTMTFDASNETLSSTTLGTFKGGTPVNLEPALRADGKMGGHFVTGHVDAVGKLRTRSKEGQATLLEVECPPEVLKYLVDKGSVTVDGISLTVVKVLRDAFTLVIIPHTETITTLGAKSPGDSVNLEADILGKYVFKFINKGDDVSDDKSLMNALRNSGYTS